MSTTASDDHNDWVQVRTKLVKNTKSSPNGYKNVGSLGSSGVSSISRETIVNSTKLRMLEALNSTADSIKSESDSDEDDKIHSKIKVRKSILDEDYVSTPKQSSIIKNSTTKSSMESSVVPLSYIRPASHNTSSITSSGITTNSSVSSSFSGTTRPLGKSRIEKPVKPSDIDFNNIECHKCVKSQIKVWADSQDDLSTMVKKFEYLRFKWERPDFFQANYTNIIEFLAKNWRGDVLEYLRINHPIYADKHKNYKDSPVTPFHKSVFPSSDLSKILLNEDGVTFNPDKINCFKKTVYELLTYGFTLYHANSKSYTRDETFIRALQVETDIIPHSVKNEMYRFLTDELNDLSIYEKGITLVLNHIDKDDKINYACDKILFMLYKYPEQITSKIFHYILSMEPSELKQNKIVTNFVRALFSTPSVDYDYTMFLSGQDVNAIRTNFVRIVLSNYKTWISDFVFRKSDGSDDNEYFDNYNKQAFINLAILFGSIYKNNLIKDEIIDSMIEWSQLNTKNKIDICMLYLVNSEIDVDNLTEKELQLIKNVIPENIKKLKLSTRNELITNFENLYQRKMELADIAAIRN